MPYGKNQNPLVIDSNVTNAQKCLGVKQNESLYEEGTWNICGK